MKRGVFWVLLLSLVGLGSVWSVQAATFNSSNFSINGNLGDSAAGGQSSTNYSLTSAAGESIAGSSTSKSYKLGQGYIPTLENSMQVVVQPNGLAAYWPLDDVTADGGPMRDESQNLNNGTYTTSAVSVAGKVGNAWNDLNGNQYAFAPDSPSLPSGSVMTTSAWIKPNDLNERAIVTKWDYGVGGGTLGEWAFQLSPTSGRLRAFISTGSGDPGNNYVETTAAVVSASIWTHVAMVYDGSQAAASRVKIYVNGIEVTTTTSGTIPTSLYAAGTNPITIGDFPGLTRLWLGSIDEVKLLGRALTSSDVKAEYDASNAGIPAGLGLGTVTPGAPQTSSFDSIVQTSAGGYTLAINQNNNLLAGGGATIPAVGGSIASPVTWSDGSTKGLGFTLFGTNATALPGTWSSGAAYAALPGLPTSFYTRNNYSGGTKDVINMRLKLDAQTSQVSGDYTNQMVVTGTMIP